MRVNYPRPSEPVPKARGDSPPAQDRPVPQPKPKPVPLPPKPKTIIHNSAVLEAASKHPRHHLGDFIYEPGLRTSRLVPNYPTHRGFSSNPAPLPLAKIKGKLNCTLTVKISHVHLSAVSREEITARAYLWGTDIYTDDSDVIAACIHGGWIKGEWSEEVDTDMLDLESEGKRRKKPQPVDPLASEGPITSTPSPMDVPADRDLHVQVLILPRLLKYGSVTRHGITSREFGGDGGSRHASHDGLSFMIQSLRWVENGAQPQARLRGKARRERMRKAMQEVHGTLNMGASTAGSDKQQIRGEITGSWWRGAEKPAEGDKENGEATKDVEMAGSSQASTEAEKQRE